MEAVLCIYYTCVGFYIWTVIIKDILCIYYVYVYSNNYDGRHLMSVICTKHFEISLTHYDYVFGFMFQIWFQSWILWQYWRNLEIICTFRNNMYNERIKFIERPSKFVSYLNVTVESIKNVTNKERMIILNTEWQSENSNNIPRIKIQIELTRID